MNLHRTPRVLCSSDLGENIMTFNFVRSLHLIANLRNAPGIQDLDSRTSMVEGVLVQIS